MRKAYSAGIVSSDWLKRRELKQRLAAIGIAPSLYAAALREILFDLNGDSEQRAKVFLLLSQLEGSSVVGGADG